MKPKYVAITGGAGGFGQAISKRLLKDGYKVISLDIENKSSLEHEDIVSITLDITNPDSIKDAVGIIRMETEELHALINLAGIFDQFALVEADADRFDRLIQVNLLGQQYVTQALFPLIKKCAGRVINISSETVLSLMPLQSYGMSKKLFDVWSAQLRMELALLDLKVITIRAGGHRTPFINDTVKVVSNLDQNSPFYPLQKSLEKRVLSTLKQINKSPDNLAKLVIKALQSKHPKKIYYSNLSLLFRMLSWLPESVREQIIIRSLKPKINRNTFG